MNSLRNLSLLYKVAFQLCVFGVNSRGAWLISRKNQQRCFIFILWIWSILTTQTRTLLRNSGSFHPCWTLLCWAWIQTLKSNELELNLALRFLKWSQGCGKRNKTKQTKKKATNQIKYITLKQKSFLRHSSYSLYVMTFTKPFFFFFSLWHLSCKHSRLKVSIMTSCSVYLTGKKHSS